MSDKTLQRLPLALAALLTCLSAHADFTSEDGRARLSGFGTVGAARTNSDDALFNYPGQGGGVDKQIGMEPDTKVGVQGSYKFTDSISGTAQLLTKYRAEGQYKPEFEWAFAKWQATPGLAIRVGRIGAPFFMVSDFRDVGYANTMVRPNLDVYGQVPVSSVNGGDISYQMSLGETVLTGTFWGGYSRADYASALRGVGNAAADPVTIRLSKQMGLNLQAEFEGGYSLRLGHMQGNLSIDSTSINTLIATAYAVPSLGPTLGARAENALLTSSTKASFTGIGFSMDRSNIVLASEYTMRRIKKGPVADTTGWYVMGGYRFGSFLPYLSFSKLKVDEVNVPTNTGLPGALGTNAQALQSTQYIAQKTTSVGVRWDAMRNTAVKLQFDRVQKPANSNGLFLVENPTATADKAFQSAKKNINVISLAVDFVF
jgi:hypothetical protein